MLAALAPAVLGLADPVETPATLAAEPAPLHGSLLTPDGAARAVAVIIAGSGPTDRNGDSPMGVRGGTYRLLAEGLAQRGVATVRFDKRGIGQSAGAGGSEADLRFSTYVDDARAWAVEAARVTGRPCAWLIGHSEGALIALAAVAQGDTAICGLVLVSGAGRPAGDLLREQLAAAPEAIRTQALAVLEELEAGRTTATPPGLEALFRPSVQPYLISWLPLDPTELIAGYDGPVMIGQGTTDLQTNMTDARALAEAQPRAWLVSWEGVNHLLKTAPAERAANLATYADPTLPLAPDVTEDIADFILEPR